MSDPTAQPFPALASGWDCHVHVFDDAAPVRPGHYLPAHRPLGEIERLARGHGIGHLVLVQPSVYGTDNSVMLRALEAGGGRHRGIAVLDPTVPDAELDRLAPRLRSRGWHVQWYARATDLPQLVTWQARTGLRFVLDHLAGLDATLPDSDPAWAPAQALAEGGAWIKLSGWYRLGATEPYTALIPTLQRAMALFGPRCVWGSDWPHTSFSPDRMPRYDSTLAPAASALDAAGLHALLHAQAEALYL